MIDFNKLETGEVLSESQYYTVEKIADDKEKVQLGTANGSIVVSREYADTYLNSANQHISEEKLNQTELINIVLSNPRIAMSIYFQKAGKKKTKKAINDELESRSAKLQADFMAKGAVALKEALQNPVTDFVPGEMRLIKGYFTGSQDERGRFNFVDMEDPKKLTKGVDSRTIQYVIVNNIKYKLK